jgi:phage baseplate assembly protein W
MNMNTADIIGRGWNFPLRVDLLGNVVLTAGEKEIEQAIFIILKTPIGQRVMRPHFGSRLNELAFAPNNPQTAARAARYVEEALGMWEPRIHVDQVQAWPHQDEHSLLVIQIDYTVKATHDPRSLVYPFYLIPEEGEE